MCGKFKIPEWGYEAHNGPAVWGQIDPVYQVCSLGGEQSPIDLSCARREKLVPVGFDYRSSSATIENTGHSIQVNPASGNGIVVDGVRYELEQFDFHHAAVYGRRRLDRPDRDADSVGRSDRGLRGDLPERLPAGAAVG